MLPEAESLRLRAHQGAVLISNGRFEDAEQVYRQILQVSPGNADAWCNLALTLDSLNRLPEAEAACRTALAIEPRHADALNNLGSVLRKLNRWPEVEEAYRQVLTLRQDYMAYSNLGAALMELGRLAEAESLFREALAMKPDASKILNNLGLVLDAMNRPSEAESAYRQALAIDPRYADAQLNLATLLLSLGRLQDAWPLYEARYAPQCSRRNAFAPAVACPQWQGESLRGRSLLIWNEQGLGDMIQFGRFIPELITQGARVTLACPDTLHRLFERIDGLNVVSESEVLAPPSSYDFWTFSASVPLHLHITVHSIPDAAWLKEDEASIEQWRPKFASLPGKRVGLVWKGNSAHPNDRNRSIPSLTTLAPLWTIPAVSFVSVQVDDQKAEAARSLPSQPILDVGPGIRDFADSAAVLAHLDLLICVDTSIAHLSGALGKPCWLLLPAHGEDWRWMRSPAERSPWYPYIRLFRQTNQGAWPELVQRVCEALKEDFA